MELRKQKEIRDIDTVDTSIRKTTKVTGQSGLPVLTRKQKRQWNSYSKRKQKQILLSSAKKVRRRMRYLEKLEKAGIEFRGKQGEAIFNELPPARIPMKQKSFSKSKTFSGDRAVFHTAWDDRRSTGENYRGDIHPGISLPVYGQKPDTRRVNRKRADMFRREIISVLDKGERKAEQIQKVRKYEQVELSYQEQVARTRRIAVSPFRIPLQLKAASIGRRITSGLREAGGAFLKYASAMFAILFILLLFLMLVASIVSGIAGEEEESAFSASGYEIVAYAQQWIGKTKYIWGAGRSGPTSWQTYADCSSFVHGVFAHFGNEIGGTTYEQENAGTLVDGGLDNALPGDIILFYSGHIAPGNSQHVAIYAGDGRMIHCSGGRANVSPATAGRGVCWGSPTGDGRPFQIRRIVVDTGEAGSASSGHRTDDSAYSRSQMELIWAIVAQEDNGSYEGALAVISSAMNRTESSAWKYCGSTALAQLTAPGQYCYSNDDYWRPRLGGNVPEYVKQAVSDCLEKGIRNHSFTSFRSTKGSVTGPDAVQIGGNWFFGS